MAASALGIYQWANQSLGQYAFLNDFATPLSSLTIALTTLLTVTFGQDGAEASSNLPQYLGAPFSPTPWDNRTSANTHPYNNVPNTNVTRTYNFSISRGIIAPDGVNKSSILINGQFPGPMIEANWGDTIEINIDNSIDGPEEATTLHMHGLRQARSPWADGTPGISQCPIAPGSTNTISFQADTYGSSWYHSHVSAQLLDGLWGPLVIYGPEDNSFDIDVGVILVHDHFHLGHRFLVANAMSNNTLTALLNPANNVLVHGTNYECDTRVPLKHCVRNLGLQKWRFTSGKVHKMRVINPSTAASPLLFSIDNHTLTVIANDFTPVVPYNTTVLSLSAGQRADVLVYGSHASTDSFFIRARLPSLCTFNTQSFGLAAVFYEHADSRKVPVSLPEPDFMTERLAKCTNDPLNITVPVYPISAAETIARTFTIDIELTVNDTGHTLYTMNGEAYRADYNDPLIALSAEFQNMSQREPTQIYDLGKTGDVTRFIFNNTLPFAHPMHLHGWQYQIVAEGIGKWNGVVINPTNPQRRDTQIVQAGGYMVADVIADNPGAWPFHCHIAWRLSAGMSITLVQQGIESDLIQKHVVPNCDVWRKWAASDRVDEIDSGI